MDASKENLQRVLQQMHAAAAAGINQPYAFGIAMSFITTVFALTKQLSEAGRLNSATEQAQKAAIAATNWTVTQSEIDSQKDLVSQAEVNAEMVASACDETTARTTLTQLAARYRHLRNCFAHGNWSYDETTITATSMLVTLRDTNPAGTQRFHAEIQLADLIELAEKLLIVTHKNM